MKRHENPYWYTDKGRLLLESHSEKEPELWFYVSVSACSLEELKELGEAIADAIALAEKEEPL